ncbi:hypothetical protein [Amycolatopsis pigmentata]|uniref:Helix-hairpin-helix domain-containing protein n=1 Tax=Amycolatopsis pigmentata TaxID=450801 RepID=A0ABW5G130_9PSEU
MQPNPADDSAVPSRPNTPGRRSFRVAGRWYYLVLVGTAGLFAWVPFLHAATRVRTAKAGLLAALFGTLDIAMYILLGLTPQDGQGQTINSPLSTVGGLLMLGVVITGCVLLPPLRRRAYENAPVTVSTPEPVTGPVFDPAIQAALAARARREESRKLAANDPLLARELRIGRPDLARSYDDGGLVDLNNAPAAVIADTCDIPAEVADAIVDTRERRGEPFSTVDELFVLADLPVNTWDRIRDRAVLVP